MKPKTIREWLNTIEDETIRNQAIENAKKDTDGFIYNEVESLRRALNLAFWWDKTPQGEDYWSDVCEQAFNGTLKTREI